MTKKLCDLERIWKETPRENRVSYEGRRYVLVRSAIGREQLVALEDLVASLTKEST